METNWTFEQLKTYILLYCADADFIQKKSELDFIKAGLQEEVFQVLQNEFEGDNDYQRVQKIQSTWSRLNLTHRDLDAMVLSMKELFQTDGSVDQLERNLLLGIKRLLG